MNIINTIKTSIIALAATATIYSCQKDYNAYPPDPPRDPQINAMRGYLTCDVNGVPFKGEIKRLVENPEFNTYTITAIEYDYTRHPENYKSISLSITNIAGYTDKKFQIGTVASASYVVSQKDQVKRIYNIIFDNAESYWKVTGVRNPSVGEFSFNAATIINGADTVRVTNGKYDFPND